MSRWTTRNEWLFFSVLPRADAPLAIGWWAMLLLRGALPALFGVAMGRLVSAIQTGSDSTAPLTFVGVIFVLLQVASPLHQAISANLGDRVAAWLYDRLTESMVRTPGMGHLEDPSLASDLTVARNFDVGVTAPPLALSMDFVAGGLVELIGGLSSAIVLAFFAPWAALILAGAWASTHWLLRESSVWRDRNTPDVRAAQRHVEYAYRLAVDPPASKELRLFGLSEWTLDRFVAYRQRLHDLQYAATRLRERPIIWSMLLVTAANLIVFGALANAAVTGSLELGALLTFAQTAVGTSSIAFGGLNWALDGSAAPVAAVLRLVPRVPSAGFLTSGSRQAEAMPRAEVRFRDVSFAYPASDGRPVLEHFDITIPAGTSLAIVGQNGAGKTTLAKLLCRLYDPQHGAIEVDGIDLRELDLAAWRSRITAVFQDFIRFEWPMRDNVAPCGGSDAAIERALVAAGADGLAGLDTVLARGYPGGTDLSGGQWQRVALARALYAVESGARLILLDEPTAQLDVRGEAEIFDRILTATRNCTTILISHRFSTVRHADQICVLENGRVVELGSHADLMALGGRYRTMFDLQAQRFEADADEEGVTYGVLA
ncbi:MAG: ABC transporter ATP-binding protein [Chloroflexota bacterium]